MPDDVPMIAYWMGQNVDEMSREELIVALKQCGAQLEASWKRSIEVNSVWRELLVHSRRCG